MCSEHTIGGERRQSDRVTFERGVDVYLMATDGTWRRDCVMQDASDSGVKLTRARTHRGPQFEAIFPSTVLHWIGLSALRAVLGQRRTDRPRFMKRTAKKK